MNSGQDAISGAGRLGRGVVIDASVLWALRVASTPEHQRVAARLTSLATEEIPLIVSYFSLVEAVRRILRDYGSEEAAALIRETRRVFNVLLPTASDIADAEELLAQGTHIDLEQALAGMMAKRLSCSIYGSAPAYHLLRVPVVLD